jgi:hypothetical protein
MSVPSTILELPKQPQAVVVEVVKLNMDTVDVHSDMWDPKWIEKK